MPFHIKREIAAIVLSADRNIYAIFFPMPEKFIGLEGDDDPIRIIFLKNGKKAGIFGPRISRQDTNQEQTVRIVARTSPRVLKSRKATDIAELTQAIR